MVKSEEGTTLNISGGAFTRTAAPRWGITGTVLVYGTTTITGGTFNEKSTSPSARVVVTGKVDGYDSVTYIKGGTFNGNGNNVFHHLNPAQADDSFEVSGGTFKRVFPIAAAPMASSPPRTRMAPMASRRASIFPGRQQEVGDAG